MRTVRIKVYQYKELSNSAKQTVILNLSDINTMNDWWKQIYECAEQIELKITGFDLNKQNITGTLTHSINTCIALIKQLHGINTNTYKLCEKYETMWNRLENENHEFDKINFHDQFKFDLLLIYLDLLNEGYEYLQTEKAIIETIEANEYEFTLSGKLFSEPN